MKDPFGLKIHSTNIRTEVLAGVTTFLTMAYIIFVNPALLSKTGMDYQSVMVATCLSAALGTLIMGLWAKYPFALAPGMGLNAFFVFTIVLTMGYTWQQALAIVFISGIIFIILTVTGLRTAIIESIPAAIKHAIPAGIGLFIAFIGLNSAGIVKVNQGPILDIVYSQDVADRESLVDQILTAPPQVLEFGDFGQPAIWVAVAGFLLISILTVLKVRGAFFLAILGTTLVGLPWGVTQLPHDWSLEGISLSATWLQLDFGGLFKLSEEGTIVTWLVTLFTVVISFTLVDLFDTIGTLLGTAAKGGFLDPNGRLPRMNKALLADAVATTFGALAGTSTVTTYIESASGIIAGGKTGLTSITVAVLFLLALLLAPLASMVPAAATAPVLIMVGLMMLDAITKIDFGNYEEMIPAILVIIIMPFSYSIANGIAIGIIVYTLIKIMVGKAREVHTIMYILTLLFILRFVLI